MQHSFNQSWRNYRNKLLKGKAPALLEIKARLRLVKQALIATLSLDAAVAIINEEMRILEAMADDSQVPAAEKGLLHLRYLSSYWLSPALWSSWSDFGRHSAAKILGCDFDGVLPTTNHLESFNGVLKRRHLRRWQRGGRRLRLDILVNVLVSEILPSIFEQRGHVTLPTVAYFTPDPARDLSARQLLDNKQISIPTHSPGGFEFTCYSSFATQLDRNPVI